MRARSDARRTAILSAAWKRFKTVGFQAALMSDIAVDAACSKATLYGYFSSKRELFTHAVDHALSAVSEDAFRHLAATGSIAERRLAFARAHMMVRLSSDRIAIDRMMVDAARHTNAYAIMRDRSVERRRRIAGILATEVASGTLHAEDTFRAAIHLIALIEFDLSDRRLYGEARIAAELIEQQVTQGVAAFLRAYAKRPAG